jgi:hypothetical protein
MVDKPYDQLKFAAHDAAHYERRHGEHTCNPELDDDFSIQAHSCVRFPFGPGVWKNKLVILGFNFVGEFQACNRPANNWSYLMLSSAATPCGLSGLGRIDFNCQKGFLFKCPPHGGVIAISRDWLAFMSPACLAHKAKIGTPKFKKTKALFKRPDTDEAATEIVSVQGLTTLAFYLGGNEPNEGVDILVALVGTVSVEVLGLIGAGANIKGQVTLHAGKRVTVSFTIRFEAEVRILFAVFKITCKVSWNVDQGWYWEWYVPPGLEGFLGDDPDSYLSNQKKGWKKLCPWCKDNWKGYSHR